MALFAGGRFHSAVHLHAARQVKLSVDGLIRFLHLEHDGVVDPVADRILFERAVGDRRRERERRRVERRNVDVEIDRGDVAFKHRLQVVALARGVGAGEINAQVIPEHETHDGPIESSFGSHADTYYGCRTWLQRADSLAFRVHDGDSDDLRAAVAEAVIDVGNAFDQVLGDGRLARDGVDFSRLIRHVFRGHGCKILRDNDIRLSDGFEGTFFEPHRAVAQGFHVAGGMRYEKNRNSLVAKLVDLAHAALAEVDVAHGESFVDQQDLGIEVNRDGEGKANSHAARIRLDGLMDEVANFGEGFDLGKAAV